MVRLYCLVVSVHGDIRHLENSDFDQYKTMGVHGDIRHLEMRICRCRGYRTCSWRHTPFRNARSDPIL